ncbi:hypothetical protein BD309DRAFT_959446 [Dichomitus squalens]|nr:hypothetical protein BD309DRAFT_959446 [Dichomitus squalens]
MYISPHPYASICLGSNRRPPSTYISGRSSISSPDPFVHDAIDVPDALLKAVDGHLPFSALFLPLSHHLFLT